MDSCIFCRIVRGEIPSEKVYEDPRVYAFHDIHPAAPVHFMLIPKLHINSLADVEDAHSALLGEMMVLVPRLAREQGTEGAFRWCSASSGSGAPVIVESGLSLQHVWSY